MKVEGEINLNAYSRVDELQAAHCKRFERVLSYFDSFLITSKVKNSDKFPNRQRGW